MTFDEREEQRLRALIGRVAKLEKGFNALDHSQYFLVDGKRPMRGDIDLGLMSIDMDSTTTPYKGIIFKGDDRFAHDFHHPSGSSAVPVGKNSFYGINAGNFTLGSTATATYHSSQNVGIGTDALKSLTLGYGNVSVGVFAGDALTTGYYNVLLGEYAGSGMVTGIGNVAMGRGSLLSGTGNFNTGVGYASLYSITTGTTNVAVGSTAGRYINSGGANQTSSTSVYVGADTRASANGNVNEIVIGNSARGQGSNTIMLGNSSVTSLLCYDTTISSPSDKRIKKNITPLTGMLGFISDLEPVTFNKKPSQKWDKEIRPHDTDPAEENPNLYAGLIAQDVKKTMKKHGVEYELVPCLDSGMLAIRYGDLIPALIGAVQELNQKVAALT